MSKSDNLKTPRLMRNLFGVLMILIYLGMGVLCFIDFFAFSSSWQWLRWVMGFVFVVYGVWRAYRQFKGMDPNIASRE